ncbi:MAG: hypothetical protein RR576_04875 [Oscillospiraceae bacterium]
MEYWQKITEQFTTMPIVVKTTAITIMRFALLALVLLFIVLILDISKNLVLHGGKHLFKEGATAVVLMLLLVAVFAPQTLKMPKSTEIAKAYVMGYDTNGNKQDFYLTASEKEKLLNLASNSKASIRIADSLPVPKKGKERYLVQLILKNSNLYIEARETRTYCYAQTQISFLHAFTDRDNAIYELLQSSAKAHK